MNCDFFEFCFCGSYILLLKLTHILKGSLALFPAFTVFCCLWLYELDDGRSWCLTRYQDGQSFHLIYAETPRLLENTHTFNSTQFSFIHIEPNYNDCHLKVQRLLSNQEKAFKNSRQQISCCEICFQSFSVHFNLLSFLWIIVQYCRFWYGSKTK